jgi:hypothetical protein
MPIGTAEATQIFAGFGRSTGNGATRRGAVIERASQRIATLFFPR